MNSSPDNPGITYCEVVWQLEETLKHESAIDLLIKLSAVLLHYYSPVTQTWYNSPCKRQQLTGCQVWRWTYCLGSQSWPAASLLIPPSLTCTVRGPYCWLQEVKRRRFCFYHSLPTRTALASESQPKHWKLSFLWGLLTRKIRREVMKSSSGKLWTVGPGLGDDMTHCFLECFISVIDMRSSTSL